MRQARQATPSKSNHTREDLRHDSRLQPITHIRSIHISSVLPFASILFFSRDTAVHPSILGTPSTAVGTFYALATPIVLCSFWFMASAFLEKHQASKQTRWGCWANDLFYCLFASKAR